MERTSRVAPRVDMLSRGFLSKRRRMYPFHAYPRDRFLTDWEVELRFQAINPAFVKELLGNKLAFHLFLRDFGLDGHSCGLVGLLAQGSFVPTGGTVDLEEALLGNGRLFLKPVSGGGGRRCRMVEEPGELPGEGVWLLEREAAPHTYASSIFPDALNTLRVLVLRDDRGAFVAGVAHRFGASREVPVDNFSQGGVACGVDPERGVLGRGVTEPGLYPRDVHDHHPVTGKRLEGVQVPYWEDLMELAVELTEAVPGLRYAGWDMFLSPEGPKVIEGNGNVANPNNLLQPHSPMLTSMRTVAFFRDHHVLSEKRAKALIRKLGAA
ncbi:MAG: sugar-transfer associated ATP-grasp domain-containing protein [Thiohalorhabdus sp.]|uniref:sugar-transfer associated ATP-grasp domain-containing protein n=1 Tax=Thiohalorhabdus sp. TaxID=3094134 RepID=UPI00397F37BF